MLVAAGADMSPLRTLSEHLWHELLPGLTVRARDSDEMLRNAIRSYLPSAFTVHLRPSVKL
jgi:hypothetical protein